MWFIVIVVTLSVLIAIPVELKSKRLLQRFWSRSCTGREWKKRFPDVSKESIREFLEEFVDAFAFSSKNRLKFSPDDKIMDIYKSLYPSPWCADALEHMFLYEGLQRRYGLDFTTIVTDDNATLGQLFGMTRKTKNSDTETMK